MTLLFIFLLLLSVNNAAKSIFENNLPLWTWECKNEKCHPIQVNNHTSKLQSLETCNMLCAFIQIWPQPTGQVSLATTALPIRADLIHLQIISTPSSIIQGYIRDAFNIMRNDLKLLERKKHGFAEWRAVDLHVILNGSSDPRMTLDTDESYRIELRFKKVPAGSLVAVITAQSFCGVRHAFETFSQLIWFDSYQETLLILEAAKIEDAPKFSYRGILIDTARSFYPITELMLIIDAMGACKLNTLHWHATDAQSFSLRLNSYPQLAKYGAYSSSALYTPNDILAVVMHARLRGVRVIIEVNTPFHIGRAWDWGEVVGLNTLAFCNYANPCDSFCDDPPCGQLNPHNPNVYDILERIYAEIIQITEVDDIFHIGGDDISDRCWSDHFNDTDPMTLWIEFTRSAIHHLEYANGKLPSLILMWASRLSDRIKVSLHDYVHVLGIQSKRVAYANQLMNGIRNVISDEDAWDFNSGMGAWYEETGGAQYNSWQRVYEYRPWSRKLGWLVEGGVATVWSSSMSSGGLETRVWPRGAALAERLWSDRVETASRQVHARLDVLQSRFRNRGIKSTPLWSMWCTQNTVTCY